LKNKKKKIKPDNKGASLVEALLSVAILSFVIVSILSGFSQQQMTTRNTAARNVAVRLAEMKMEEILKFPTPQLTEETFRDYVIAKGNGFEVFDEATAGDPNEQKQYRRTCEVDIDMLGQIATISVTVDYPLTGTVYPSRVQLRTKRGVK
jgi:type II secretory pathway pseudopilin PulG